MKKPIDDLLECFILGTLIEAVSSKAHSAKTIRIKRWIRTKAKMEGTNYPIRVIQGRKYGPRFRGESGTWVNSFNPKIIVLHPKAYIMHGGRVSWRNSTRRIELGSEWLYKQLLNSKPKEEKIIIKNS